MTKYFYTHIFFNATEIAFQGNRLDAEKIALKYNMRIKEERKGYIVLIKDAAAEIFEHDENENIVRSVDPRPYLIKNGSEADLTEKEVEKIDGFLDRILQNLEQSERSPKSGKDE